MLDAIGDAVVTLFDTFGVYYVLGTWLFMASALALVLGASLEEPSAQATVALFAFVLTPFSLWCLHVVYTATPIPREVFGFDLTDVSTATFVFVFASGFLSEVVDHLRIAPES
ncbi:hypothetical protein J2752_000150 [Halarchaeum rubridurum]|uniref:Uncharacterized protein n=1 Tax=Halarchaeum rubridurum TaxID=489911 RepID=A0A830FYE0_9EURY|nr:hypothetical protein [Halarchaeum rubridurum]MBP1953269.1 hypothetical protein [Halarchaeum rubridurum]GGM66579.1 hypothetical protein GCM10009017_15850 [Halarchaeum rubridurum]